MSRLEKTVFIVARRESGGSGKIEEGEYGVRSGIRKSMQCREWTYGCPPSCSSTVE